jgi:hypothetical protein
MRIALLVAAAVLLAGCSDAPPASDAGTGSPGPHMGHDGGTHLLAPEWTLGDWWTWTSPQIDGPYTSVVAGDEGGDWLMATDHDSIAWFDARFDIASLGQVRKTDLAGSQGSTRVEFFQFPLTQGRSWTTTWDGLTMAIKVLSVADGVASLEAKRPDGTLYALYTYRDNHGYFGQMTYYDAAGSEVGFEAQVAGSGSGFNRELVRWTYTTELEMSGPIAGAGFGQNLPVPLTVTDVYVDLVVDCGSGSFVAGVAPLPIVTAIAGFEDRGAGTTDGACPLQMAYSGSAGEPRPTVPGSTEEQWGFSGFGDPSATGTFTFNIYLRTREAYALGA